VEIGTVTDVVTVILTLVLAVLALGSNRAAGKSAHAAEIAARSAEKALDAANMQAAAATAALLIDFDVILDAEYDEHPEGLGYIPVIEQLRVICTGANVYIHQISLDYYLLMRADKSLQLNFAGEELEILDPEEPKPILRHRGERIVCNWPGPMPLQGDQTRHGAVIIEYSLTQESPRRITRSITMPTDDKGLPPAPGGGRG